MAAPGFRLAVGEYEIPNPVALDQVLTTGDHRQVASPQRPIGEEGDREAVAIVHGRLECHDTAVRKIHQPEPQFSKPGR